MSMYARDSIWALEPGYNTARGKILDGICVSQSRYSWEKGEKHGVEDGSTHHLIIKYLEAQPLKRARFADIDAAVPHRAPLDHYLRETKKQQLARWMGQA
jgi:hypothetical protein